MAPFPDTIRRLSSADGGVLLDLRRGAMFRVNPLGARIIDLLAGQHSPREIADRISTEFGVERDVVQADVADFLRSLAAHGILDSQSSGT
jgi:hypothetical protein